MELSRGSAANAVDGEVPQEISNHRAADRRTHQQRSHQASQCLKTPYQL
jgi:hypothetical protein